MIVLLYDVLAPTNREEVMIPNMRNWLMRPEEAIAMMNLEKGRRLENFYAHLLVIKSPGGVRHPVRPYVTALAEFLNQRKATPSLAAEFANSPSGIEIANKERNRYAEWIEGRVQASGGYLIARDIELLFNVRRTVISRWVTAKKLKVRIKSGHGTTHFFIPDVFKKNCPIEGPGSL